MAITDLLNFDGVMNAMDAVNGQMGMVFWTVNGIRKKMFNITKLSAKAEIDLKDVPLLGTTRMGHKPGGVKFSFEGEIYDNSPALTAMIIQYKRTGLLPSFDTEVYNYDPQALNVGSRICILKDCQIKGGVLAQVDTSGDFLKSDISGTFEDVELPKNFRYHMGM
jgi:hypothetical protein